MGTMAYALKVFENESIVAYEYGNSPEIGAAGTFVVSKMDTKDWHVFTTSDRRREAEVTYMKLLRLLTETGEWRKGVGYNS